MSELLNLPNIGKAVEQQLLQIGITNLKQLSQVGSKQAWLSIKAFDPSACYNRLCALEAAIQGVRWHNLDETIKQELKKFYQVNK